MEQQLQRRAVQLVGAEVMQQIANHVADRVEGAASASVLLHLATVCRAWGVASLGALYRRPPLQRFDSFERLLAVLPLRVPGSHGLLDYNSSTYADDDKSESDGGDRDGVTYAALVRELDLCGAAADNLYIGDLDGALALCAASLRILRLGSVFHMSNMVVQSIATHCPRLLQLELPGCPVSDAFVPLLAQKCSDLLRLDAAFTNLSVAALIPIIKFAAALLELDLSECREADPNIDLTPLHVKRPLKFLNLRNTQITDPLLSFTIIHCPFLEILILESCPKVTDDSLAPLFSSCPNLRSLDISFCENITDKTVNAITLHATQLDISATLRLEEFYLSSCDFITPLAIHHMVAQAPRLELLVLDGCEQIVSSFVKNFAIKGDDLECTLERDGLLSLRNLAPSQPFSSASDSATVPSGQLSPPMSPVLQMHNMMSDLKVEVSYAGTAAKNAITKGTVEGLEYKALQEAAANSSNQRRGSTLRHRKSLLGLSGRVEPEDIEEVQEAAKQERVEKIREKRRSGNFFTPNRTPQPSTPSLSNNDLHERFLAAASFPRPTDSPTSASATSLPSMPEEDSEASKAAFLAAAAAKGLKISAPSSTVALDPSSTSPKPMKKRPSSILRADVAAFIPSSPPTDRFDMEDSNYSAPAAATKEIDTRRRISVGIPSGPPPPDKATWSAPVGIAPSPNSSNIVSPIPIAPETITTPTGETGVLLFSGRKAAAAAAARQSSVPVAAASQSLPTNGIQQSTGSVEEEAPVVIASGRRRTRGVSITDDSKAAAVTTSFASAVSPVSNALPPWATAPPQTPATTASAPWGTDPTVWNNPAQLTSASSTWSSAQQQQFNDPWGASRAGSGSEISQQHQQSGTNGGKGEPATSVLGPAPVINSLDPWAAPPPSAANIVQPPASVVTNANLGGGGGVSTNPGVWQQQQQQNISNGVVGKPGPINGSGTISSPPPTRPTLANSRFGNVGNAGISNIMSTPPGLLANPPGLGGVISRGASNSVPAAAASTATGVVSGEKSAAGFVYSVQNRGPLLLKLKIETKIGGEQMLAVHEYDDPQQLATEFVNYWELQAFKDPLVRLIAVRKTNVLRNRRGMNA
ncbi:hypothetical protein HK100_007790 [Physocladia obscura]|uniref:Uncharacterized protein n=1 Tax=Physocladia obscura TaxID=109957 RepID=A0AAD5TC10_9FUNG|nr:hypothetical protein HK100_007790 [Physocladia obscura]